MGLRARLCLLGLLILALALRLWGASSRALWIDEAFCVRLAQFDWGEIVTRAAADNHPPLFFAILKVWMAAVGTSPFGLRCLDLIIALATVWLVHALALRVYRTTLARDPAVPALIATAWVVVHPIHVLWSSQVRMYALAALLAVASALLLLRALERPLDWSRWAAWTTAAIALVYTHYFGAFIVLAQGVYALVTVLRGPAEQRRASLVRVIVAGVIVCAAFAPWLRVVMTQTGRLPGDWWMPPLTPGKLMWTWARTAGFVIEDEFARTTTLQAITSGGLGIALAAIVVVAAVQRDRGLRLVAWCTLVPVVASVVVTLVVGESVVLARYLIVVEGFLPIAVVGVLFDRLRPWFAALAMAPIAALLAITLVAQLPALSPKPDIPAAAAWIDTYRQPGDLLLVSQFYYWQYRLLTSPRDPALRLYTVDGRPFQMLGAAAVSDDDILFGPGELAHATGRVIVVDSQAEPAAIPPSYRRLFGKRFATWMPAASVFTIRVTFYEAH